MLLIDSLLSSLGMQSQVFGSHGDVGPPYDANKSQFANNSTSLTRPRATLAGAVISYSEKRGFGFINPDSAPENSTPRLKGQGEGGGPDEKAGVFFRVRDIYPSEGLPQRGGFAYYGILATDPDSLGSEPRAVSIVGGTRPSVWRDATEGAASQWLPELGIGRAHPRSDAAIQRQSSLVSRASSVEGGSLSEMAVGAKIIFVRGKAGAQRARAPEVSASGDYSALEPRIRSLEEDTKKTVTRQDSQPGRDDSDGSEGY